MKISKHEMQSVLFECMEAEIQDMTQHLKETGLDPFPRILLFLPNGQIEEIPCTWSSAENNEQMLAVQTRSHELRALGAVIAVTGWVRNPTSRKGQESLIVSSMLPNESGPTLICSVMRNKKGIPVGFGETHIVESERIGTVLLLPWAHLGNTRKQNSIAAAEFSKLLANNMGSGNTTLH